MTAIATVEADWEAQGLCVKLGLSPEVFFPEVEDDYDPAQAKQVCQACPSMQPCLERAMANRKDNRSDKGVWGGTTEAERAIIQWLELTGGEYCL
jgi:hypothetical protein